MAKHVQGRELGFTIPSLRLCSRKRGARPPRALPTGALAGWHHSVARHQKANSVPRLQKWFSRAPTTAPVAGALPFKCIVPAKHALQSSSKRGQRLLRLRWIPPDSFAKIGRNDPRCVVPAQTGDVTSGVG